MGLFTKESNYRIQAQNEEKKLVQILARYDAQLENYRSTLEECQRQISENGKIVQEFKQHQKTAETMEKDQMAAVQVALDLTYIKEELDEVKQHQDDLLSGKPFKIAEKLDEITAKLNSVNTSSGTDTLRRQLQSMEANLDQAIKRTESTQGKKNKSFWLLLIFSLLLNLMATGGIVYMILVLI